MSWPAYQYIIYRYGMTRLKIRFGRLHLLCTDETLFTVHTAGLHAGMSHTKEYCVSTFLKTHCYWFLKTEDIELTRLFDHDSRTILATSGIHLKIFEESMQQSNRWILMTQWLQHVMLSVSFWWDYNDAWRKRDGWKEHAMGFRFSQEYMTSKEITLLLQRAPQVADRK